MGECKAHMHWSKSHGRAWERGGSNNLWITSLWVNIKAQSLFFIISQRHWAPGREASVHMRESSPNYKMYLNTPIFSQKGRKTMKPPLKSSLHVSEWVCVFSWGDGRAFAGETTDYTQREVPIICLNTPPRIVVIITSRVVITGITASLTSISWELFGLLSQTRWNHSQ